VAVYIDLRSRFVYVKLLRYKSDNYRAFLEVVQDGRARSGKAMRFFKSDGDGIFTGSEALSIYSKFFIRHIQSAPGDSASNDVAERTIRTIAELTRTNLLHSGAPPTMWGEAMYLVVFVWNNIAVFPNPLVKGAFLSRTALLEGHQRSYDISNFRAFGTKCFWMLTLEKKGGRKEAIGAKARPGAIVGIEDNMPAYRVYDFELRGARKIPFAQVITHEGHFPFRKAERWTAEEKDLPDSFIPSLEAHADAEEWRKFRFSDEEARELEENVLHIPTSSSAMSSHERGGSPPSFPPIPVSHAAVPDSFGEGGSPSLSHGLVVPKQ
jgi:hypothetical protein